MANASPDTWGVVPGDVAHVRSSSVYGRVIRRVLPGAWGNHDGVIVWTTTEGWAIAEMTAHGFVLTPWADYRRAIAAGTTGVVFLRPCGITVAESARVAAWMEDEAIDPPAYDWLGILSHGVNVLLRVSTEWHREWKWYCTEHVAAGYAAIGRNVWGTDLPTPYTTEKRIRSGHLEVVAVRGVGKMAWGEGEERDGRGGRDIR